MHRSNALTQIITAGKTLQSCYYFFFWCFASAQEPCSDEIFALIQIALQKQTPPVTLAKRGCEEQFLKLKARHLKITARGEGRCLPGLSVEQQR